MKKGIGAGLVLLGLLVVTGTAAQIAPMAVSPGSERGVALVGQTCPTFSWTAVDWAAGYRVAVFEALGVQVPSYEEMAAGTVPALRKEIAGRALSWTPSAEEQLSAGSLYVWYVQAADSSGQGVWSPGKLFMVEAGLAAGLSEERMAKTLREKGIREDVISDVLSEMKIEGQGVLSGKTDSKPQGKIGALGSEGDSNTFYGLGAGSSITTGLTNTFIGRSAGFSDTQGNNNTFIGYQSGYSNTGTSVAGADNTFLGYRSGYSSTTSIGNTFLGYEAGFSTTVAVSNTFIGYRAGRANINGFYNAFLGFTAGYSNTTGNSNSFIGYGAGRYNTTGYNNTYLGQEAGYYNTTGNNNVFIGYRVGYNEAGSNKLYIANSWTTTPLIYGDFSSNILGINGWLGVGTQSPLYPMEVKTSGRNSVLVVQREGGALNFMNASTAYGQFGTGNAYPVRVLVNSAWRMSLNLDNSLTMANGASCTAGGVWTDASSRELKENIEGLSVAEAEEALRELVPVKYNYKADKAERHVGFIAEDAPELVASKDRKTMSPMNVVGVLTKVMQEQQKAILEQQKTIAELKAQMDEMKKRGR